MAYTNKKLPARKTQETPSSSVNPNFSSAKLLDMITAQKKKQTEEYDAHLSRIKELERLAGKKLLAEYILQESKEDDSPFLIPVYQSYSAEGKVYAGFAIRSELDSANPYSYIRFLRVEASSSYSAIPPSFVVSLEESTRRSLLSQWDEGFSSAEYRYAMQIKKQCEGVAERYERHMKQKQTDSTPNPLDSELVLSDEED